MKIWLTRGMFGEKTELLAEIETADQVMKIVSDWKNDIENMNRYKIESYDRFIFEENSVAVDFGDYYWFMLFEELTPSDKKILIGEHADD